MAEVMRGVSKAAWTFVKENLGALITISVPPVIVIVLLGAIYLVAASTGVIGAPGTEDAEATPASPSLSASALIIAYQLITTFVWIWLGTKVLRFYLTREVPSAIGSGGTLRAAGWLFVYIVGLAVIILGAFIGSDTVARFMLALTQSQVIYTLALVLCTLIVIWIASRLLVGIVPVALGEKPNLFSGWRLSAKADGPLFFRVIAPGIIMLVAMIAMLVFWVFTFGNPLQSVDDGPGGTGQIVLFQIVLQVVTVAFFWYYAALFAEAYLRLSRRKPPLATV